MKKSLLALSLLTLSGCAVVDAYMMTKYDPNEYALITSIRAEAQTYKDHCDDLAFSRNAATKVATDTQTFVLYSEHIPKNKDMISAGNQLNEIAKGLADQYAKTDKVSPAFCKIKFNSIEQSADKMQTVIGGRPR
jgi:hypothetical protein